MSQTLHKKITCCSVEGTHICSALHRNMFAIVAFLPMKRILKKKTSTPGSPLNFFNLHVSSWGIVQWQVPSQGLSLLDPREGYIWARLRGWFGQPRVLNPAPSLHGLRELPFMCQLSFISIVCNLF